MAYNAKEDFPFPFDSSWNNLDMYEKRKLNDTPLTDPTLRPQLLDNPSMGLADTNYPKVLPPTLVYPGDPLYPYPNQPHGLPFPIFPNRPGGPYFPILPNIPEPGDIGNDPYPKPNYPTQPAIPTYRQSPTRENGDERHTHDTSSYDSTQIPIPRYNQYWPRAGVDNTLPIPSIDTSITDFNPTLLF